MSNEEAFEQAAQASYDSEMADVRKAHELLQAAHGEPEEGDDRPDWEREDAARAKVQEEYAGEPLDVQHVDCIQVLLTTGGPARGYYLFVDGDHEPLSGFYWYQDWFMPKRVFWLDSDELDQVVEAYDLYLGE